MFVWRYLDSLGEEVGHSQSFADAQAAEEWMGGSWADLRENGVEEVVLVDRLRGRSLYRMGTGAD